MWKQSTEWSHQDKPWCSSPEHVNGMCQPLPVTWAAGVQSDWTSADCWAPIQGLAATSDCPVLPWARGNPDAAELPSHIVLLQRRPITEPQAYQRENREPYLGYCCQAPHLQLRFHHNYKIQAAQEGAAKVQVPNNEILRKKLRSMDFHHDLLKIPGFWQQ